MKRSDLMAIWLMCMSACILSLTLFKIVDNITKSVTASQPAVLLKITTAPTVIDSSTAIHTDTAVAADKSIAKKRKLSKPAAMKVSQAPGFNITRFIYAPTDSITILRSIDTRLGKLKEDNSSFRLSLDGVIRDSRINNGDSLAVDFDGCLFKQLKGPVTGIIGSVWAMLTTTSTTAVIRVLVKPYLFDKQEL